MTAPSKAPLCAGGAGKPAPFFLVTVMALGSGQSGGGDYSSSFAGLGTFGGAAQDLLGQQLEGETEEMKRRRLLLEQMKEAVSPLGASSMLGLPGTKGGLSAGMGGLRARRGG